MQKRNNNKVLTRVVEHLAEHLEGAGNSVRLNHNVVVSLELHAALTVHLVTV